MMLYLRKIKRMRIRESVLIVLILKNRKGRKIYEKIIFDRIGCNILWRRCLC